MYLKSTILSCQCQGRDNCIALIAQQRATLVHVVRADEKICRILSKTTIFEYLSCSHCSVQNPHRFTVSRTRLFCKCRRQRDWPVSPGPCRVNKEVPRDEDVDLWSVVVSLADCQGLIPTIATRSRGV